MMIVEKSRSHSFTCKDQKKWMKFIIFNPFLGVGGCVNDGSSDSLLCDQAEIGNWKFIAW